MPTAPRPTTRRTALVLGTVGAASLTACSLLEDKVPGSAAQVADDPDADLVDEAVARISATAAVAAQVPQLVAMHTAHLAALEADTATASPSGSPSGPPTTRADVRRAERDLKTYLVDASLRAESGPLARLLASMSAAVSQQLTVLPREAA